MEAGGPEALVVGGGRRHGGVLRDPCPTELGGAASPARSDDPWHHRQRPLVAVQQGGAAPAAALLDAHHPNAIVRWAVAAARFPTLVPLPDRPATPSQLTPASRGATGSRGGSPACPPPR